MMPSTTDQQFFEHKYKAASDPWNFEGSAYERQRYALILGEIEPRHWQRGFEPGCSIGILTQSLALHCDRLEAIDISPTAAGRAQARCQSLPNVNVRCGSLPEGLPGGDFDLIVFSEIGYYFEREALQDLVGTLAEKLVPGGVFLAAHWLGASVDHLLSGDEVHAVIEQAPSLVAQRQQRFPLFRLDRMVRR